MRTVRNDGMTLDIGPRMEALKEHARSLPGLVAVYLYGSYGTPFQTPLSDVDLALVFLPGAVPGSRERIDIAGRITEVLDQDDVSLSVLNRCDSLFRFRVISTGRLVYCADRTALADFVEDTLVAHGDFINKYEAFVREYDAAMAERYAS